MTEFNSRIEAQRQVLQIVNSRPWAEELFSLSSKAIQRWIFVNRLNAGSSIVSLVQLAAKELFFLANHSEDQISREYLTSAQQIAEIARLLKTEMQGGGLEPEKA
jgi:hypothetical protein